MCFELNKYIKYKKNYRPVSALSFLLKVVERVVASQLKSHLAANNLDNMNQSAYKAGHFKRQLC